MKTLMNSVVVLAIVSGARAETVKRDIPYAEPADERQMLDVYAPANARNLPVVFWIHGGGWQTGDKASVHAKPKAFTEKGYVFVSTNYRLLPAVDMETIVRDVAKSIHWVHDHIAEYGGDPQRLVVAGHSAGAQLAALICTDVRYLKAEGLSLSMIKGCIPVDGDTYDVPMMIEAAQPDAKLSASPIPNSATLRSSVAIPRNTGISRPSTMSRIIRASPPFCSCMSPTIPTPVPRPGVWARFSTKPASPRRSSEPRIQTTPRLTRTSACPMTRRRRQCLTFVGEMVKK